MFARRRVTQLPLRASSKRLASRRTPSDTKPWTAIGVILGIVVVVATVVWRYRRRRRAVPLADGERQPPPEIAYGGDRQPPLELTYGIEMECFVNTYEFDEKIKKGEIDMTKYAHVYHPERIIYEVVAEALRSIGVKALSVFDPLADKPTIRDGFGHWMVINDSSVVPSPSLGYEYSDSHYGTQARTDIGLEIVKARSVIGLEIVSRKLSMSFEDNQIEDRMEEVMDVLKKLHADFELSVNRNCGLHVHVSDDKRRLPLATVRRLLAMGVAFEHLVHQTMSEDRIGVDSLGWQYSRPNSMLDENRFATMTDQIELIRSAGGYSGLMSVFAPGKKVAYNMAALSKYGTLEFRQHSGCVDPLEIMSWAKFCCHFVHFAHRSTDAEVFDELIGKRMNDPDYQFLDLLRTMRAPELEHYYAVGVDVAKVWPDLEPPWHPRSKHHLATVKEDEIGAWNPPDTEWMAELKDQTVYRKIPARELDSAIWRSVNWADEEKGFHEQSDRKFTASKIEGTLAESAAAQAGARQVVLQGADEEAFLQKAKDDFLYEQYWLEVAKGTAPQLPQDSGLKDLEFDIWKSRSADWKTGKRLVMASMDGPENTRREAKLGQKAERLRLNREMNQYREQYLDMDDRLHQKYDVDPQHVLLTNMEMESPGDREIETISQIINERYSDERGARNEAWHSHQDRYHRLKELSEDLVPLGPKSHFSDPSGHEYRGPAGWSLPGPVSGPGAVDVGFDEDVGLEEDLNRDVVSQEGEAAGSTHQEQPSGDEASQVVL